MILFLALFSSSTFSATVPFAGIPSAKTVPESHALFQARADSVLNYFAEQDLGTYSRSNGTGFPVKAMAKLSLGRDVEKINSEILSPNMKPYALVGTDFTALNPLCVRNGDYDFSLRGLVALTTQFWDRSDLLWPEAREKLMREMLTETGNSVSLHRTFCGFVKIKETENHILLTEGGRYLTNQLWLRWKKENPELQMPMPLDHYNNTKNGMRNFLVQHLGLFLKHDFEEYNSRPYSKFTIAALQTIFEYAEDDDVKHAARSVLDYISGRYATQSKGNRRSVPICRQPEHRDDQDILRLDPIVVQMHLLTGDLDHVSELGPNVVLNDWPLVGFALGSYRIPDLILDLILGHSEQGREYFQVFHHLGYEAFHGTEKFLISAGGKFINQFDMATGKIDGWAVPTTIIPAVEGIEKIELIRMEGDRRHNFKNNLCIARGFACGLNVRLPDSIPESCREVRAFGNTQVIFYDFTAATCPKNWGYYVAVYIENCDSPRCKIGADNFGFFEVQMPKITFADFKAGFLRNLGPSPTRKFSSARWNHFVLTNGDRVQFHPNPIQRGRTSAFSSADPWVPKLLRQWPAAQGEYFRSRGDGIVEIHNPYLRSKLRLESR